MVELITKNGGQAVANTDNVATPEGAQAIVQPRVDAFGKIDIVVNNAGILRDKSFGKMTVEDFDSVLAVHVRGSYLVSRAAYPYMKEAGYGRIVNTSSPAGLFGNFGQANYSTAKMGLVGLTKTLGIEGARSGIKANAIAPIAWTRMTESILPAEFEAKFTRRAGQRPGGLPRARVVRGERRGVQRRRRPGGAGVRGRGARLEVATTSRRRRSRTTGRRSWPSSPTC